MGQICRYLFILSIAALIGFGQSEASAQQKVEFPGSSKWKGSKITLRGELLGAGGKKKPAVILLHGCGGLQSSVRNSLRTHAKRLVRAGFAALILDSFGPRGISGGWVCVSDQRLISAAGYRKTDVRDAIRYLRARGDVDMRNVFAMGQSNGGTTVLALARRGRSSGLRAVAAYYPYCGGSGSYSMPVMIFAGAKDDWTPASLCEKHRRGRTSVIVYPNAVHSFDLPINRQRYQGHLVGRDAGATSDSRSKMVAFFRKNVAR